MLELFGIVGSWKLIDLAIDEKDIVYTMLQHEKAHCPYDYLIHNTDGSPDIEIRSKEEFDAYMRDYKERHTYPPLEDMSCLELKRFILDKQERNKTR